MENKEEISLLDVVKLLHEEGKLHSQEVINILLCRTEESARETLRYYLSGEE